MELAVQNEREHLRETSLRVGAQFPVDGNEPDLIDQISQYG